MFLTKKQQQQQQQQSSNNIDGTMAQVVQEQRVEHVVEKFRMVLARTGTIRHEVNLANHGLDRLLSLSRMMAV